MKSFKGMITEKGPSCPCMEAQTCKQHKVTVVSESVDADSCPQPASEDYWSTG